MNTVLFIFVSYLFISLAFFYWAGRLAFPKQKPGMPRVARQVELALMLIYAGLFYERFGLLWLATKGGRIALKDPHAPELAKFLGSDHFVIIYLIVGATCAVGPSVLRLFKGQYLKTRSKKEN